MSSDDRGPSASIEEGSNDPALPDSAESAPLQPARLPVAHPVHAAPPPKKSNAWKWVVGILVGAFLLCGGGLAACTSLFAASVNEADKQQKAKVDHVKLVACNVQRADSDFLANVKADLEINNTGKNQESYFIDVFVFNSAGERVGNGTAMVTDVRPGRPPSTPRWSP